MPNLCCVFLAFRVKSDFFFGEYIDFELKEKAPKPKEPLPAPRGGEKTIRKAFFTFHF